MLHTYESGHQPGALRRLPYFSCLAIGAKPVVKAVRIEAIVQAHRQMSGRDRVLRKGAEDLVVGRGFQSPWPHPEILKAWRVGRKKICISDRPQPINP